MTNEEVDQKILKALYGRSLKFGELRSNISAPENEPDMRQVDRRLQALKKQKKVKFNTKTGWSLLP